MEEFGKCVFGELGLTEVEVIPIARTSFAVHNSISLFGSGSLRELGAGVA